MKFVSIFSSLPGSSGKRKPLTDSYKYTDKVKKNYDQIVRFSNHCLTGEKCFDFFIYIIFFRPKISNSSFWTPSFLQASLYFTADSVRHFGGEREPKQNNKVISVEKRSLK